MKKTDCRKKPMCGVNSYLAMLFITAVMPILLSCYDFNLFKLLRDYDKLISEADSEKLFFLLDDRDVVSYLTLNKSERDKHIAQRIELAHTKTGTEKVILYFAIIKIIMKTTEISDTTGAFALISVQNLLAAEKNLVLKKLASEYYRNIKGRDREYVSNYINYSIKLQTLFSLLGAELETPPQLPDEINERVPNFSEQAFISSVFYFLYRFHRVISIDQEGNPELLSPICKVEVDDAGCDPDQDDYRDVLIEYLTNTEGYENIFTLQIEDFEHLPYPVTKVPVQDLSEVIFRKGFLYDNDQIGDPNFADNIIELGNLNFIIEKLNELGVSNE